MEAAAEVRGGVTTTAEVFDAETVAKLANITATDLRSRHRKNGYWLTGFEQANIEEAVLEGLSDLVQKWATYPSSLTGDHDAISRKALKRLRWETPKFVDAERSRRSDLLTQREIDELRGLATPESDDPDDKRRERRKGIVRWALSEMPQREQHVLCRLHGEPEPPSKRGLARELGLSEGMIRKVESLAKQHFRELVEPWLCVL